MNKLEIMKQSSLDVLLAELVRDSPGITSERMWSISKDWDHKLLGWEFDAALVTLRREYRCTNKKWYPPFYEAEPKVSTGSKVDPRQTRMDW
jgi:hypothetical protein